MIASGRNGMATSPHVLATRAGFDVLKAGGNAIEAAIAIGATIGVVYPHFCGLGGDAVWLVADRHGDRDCFLGIGQAAAELPAFQHAIPLRGPLSMLTSACAVDTWGHAHSYSIRRWRGRMPFSALLADAIRHAREGFPVSRSQAFWLDFRRSEAGDLARICGSLHAGRGCARGREPFPAGRPGAVARTHRARRPAQFLRRANWRSALWPGSRRRGRR